MKSYLTIVLVLLCQSVPAQDLNRSTVSVTVTAQGFDYYSPWKRGGVTTKTLTGCVLKGERILTLAQPLANHVLVEVSKFGSERRYPADVLLKDYNCGLALLSIRDKGFFADLAPAELAPAERPVGRAQVASWDPQGNLKTYAAEAFSTSIGLYGACGIVLIHQMTTGLDSGGNGEPVFLGRRLLGITLYFDSERKTIKVCGVDNIRRMLQDVDAGKYRGMPFFVVGAMPLNSDENLREYLGLGPNDTGLLVTSVPPKTSGHDVLKKNDVILSMDGVAIDDRGLYDSGAYGKLNYYGIISLRHAVGDKVTMQIVRDKKKMDVSFELLPATSECYLIPLLDYDTPPQYTVFGGLVFQELTEGYVASRGKEVDRRLLFLFDGLKLMPSPERKRCVILNRVLPASVNAGYHDKGNLVLLAINGISIRDLRHLKEVVETAKDKFLKFSFQGGEDIVLDRQWVAETTDSILKKYNITAASYLAER